MLCWAVLWLCCALHCIACFAWCVHSHSDYGDECYLLLTGCVCEETTHPQTGFWHIVSTKSAGQCVGEAALIPPEPAFEAAAITSSEEAVGSGVGAGAGKKAGGAGAGGGGLMQWHVRTTTATALEDTEVIVVSGEVSQEL